MNTANKTLLGIIAAIVVLIALVFAFDNSGPASYAPGGGAATTTPPAGPLTVVGVVVCLPHKDTSGVQTMECAFGIRDGEGRYFALSDTDPSYGNLMDLPFNSTKVEVSGTFTPRSDSNYQDIGVIAVTSVRIP